MPTLKDFIKQKYVDDSALAEFAQRCGTTVGQMKQVAGGYRRAGESLAINIERESGGAVRCEDLRPDVDWAYIRSTRADSIDGHSADRAANA
jgi:DNA-binding transcriptional regulator YdaS (Cro superfamily)